MRKHVSEESKLPSVGVNTLAAFGLASILRGVIQTSPIPYFRLAPAKIRRSIRAPYDLSFPTSSHKYRPISFLCQHATVVARAGFPAARALARHPLQVFAFLEGGETFLRPIRPGSRPSSLTRL